MSECLYERIMIDETNTTSPTLAQPPQASMTPERPSAATDEMVELTVDGQSVQVPKGTPIYDAITGMGKVIPAMCYHYTFSPFGSCGICLVEIEGKKAPVRSCSSNVAPGMVVRTDTPALFQARKKGVEKHLSTHPLDCPVCDADGRCELQDMSYSFGISEVKNVKQKGIPEDRRSLVLDFNMNRCILCGQCINICKEVQQVDALQFLKKGGFTHVVARGDTALHCEFCGDCLTVCPVGAITNKFAKYLYKPWQLVSTNTTCGYCGDGCEMIIDAKEQDVIRVRSPLSWKSKWGTKEDTLGGHGGICVKGRFGFQHINSKQRLSQPLLRRGRHHEPVSWWEATNEVASRLGAIKAQHGPEAIAGLVSARLTNEELYLFQKFMRAVVGTNQFDSTARYGQINFTRALQNALGRPRLMNTYEELTVANTILVIGSDITEANPITALRVKEAMRHYKSAVIVVNPIKTKMAALATHHLAIRPGSEGIFLQGVVRALLAQQLIDPAFAKANPALLTALRNATAAWNDDALSQATDVDAAKFNEVAALLAKGPRTILVCGEGLLKQADGYVNALSLIEVAGLCGALARTGSGVMALQEENNEQGVIDFGAVPDLLPGPALLSDPAARLRAGALWQAEVPSSPGATLTEILERARKGAIKALYIIGENPIETLPASMKAAEALERVELLVCQELFMTETARSAHVVLPACSAAEKMGSFTNHEGKYCPVVRSLEPKGESRPDWEIIEEIAGKMAPEFFYGGVEEIQDEISRLVPGFPKAPLPRRLDGPPRFVPGHAVTVASRYRMPAATFDVGARAAESVGIQPPHRLGGAHDLAAPSSSQRAPSDAPTPRQTESLTLQLIPILYHSGKLSLQADGLTSIYPKGRLGLSAFDAERIGAAKGAVVRLTSVSPAVRQTAAAAQPQVEVEVEVQPSLPKGLCVFPEHFNTPGVKDLMPVTIDPVTQVPYFKRGEVTITLVTPAPSSVGARAVNSEEVSSDAPTPPATAAIPPAASPQEPAP
jgi:formate dehydrogenase alpha subunit